MKAQWRHAVIEGGSAIDDVVMAPDGLARWFWLRWRAVDRFGLDETAFRSVIMGYRRELWFWLAGERTWSQCVSGLLGRIDRRVRALSTPSS